MQIDVTIQNMFKAFKNIKWRECESNSRLSWYYAEDMHYIVTDSKTNAYWFVKAKSPASACEYVIRKLTNEGETVNA